MPLEPKANKETQIHFINQLEQAIGALIAFAQGDENALDVLLSEKAIVAPKPVVVPTTDIAIEAAFTPVANVDKCVCPLPVKDDKSVTHLCVLCRKNAYGREYILANTDEGQALIVKSNLRDQPTLPGVVLLPFPGNLAELPITEDEDDVSSAYLDDDGSFA